MKQCRKCQIEKPLLEFRKRRKDKGYGSYCIECCRWFNRESRAKKLRETPKEFKEQDRKSRQKSLDRNTKFVVDYLYDHPCVDCGETNPLVLDFDHIKQKEKNISSLVVDKATIQRITDEIDKCQVRCANCHRIKTAYDRKYKILKFLKDDKERKDKDVNTLPECR